MLTNEGVWDYYQPGFVHSEYVPYLDYVTKDAWGNTVKINRWEKQGPVSTVQPELVRINKGLRFQKLHEEDPCPNGFQKDNDNLGYCEVAPLVNEPIFYTDKAFIAKKQFWRGPGDPTPGSKDGSRSRTSGYRDVSEPTDMRSVDPLSGQYKVYYHPVMSSAQNRYMNPVPGPEKYDKSWNPQNMARQNSYANMATTDSYLG